MAGKYLKSIQIINDNLQITTNDNIDQKYITHIKYKQNFNLDILFKNVIIFSNKIYHHTENN